MHPMTNIAIRAARDGGRILMRYLDRVDALKIETKSRNDFVSDVDRAAEEAVIHTISKAYPKHAILAEESGAYGEDQTLEVGGVRIDKRKRQVTKQGAVVELTVREFELLTFLASRAGEVVSRDSLLDVLWPGVHVTPRTIDVHIAALRKKLEDDPSSPTLLVGVRGVGYRMEGASS